ncbi:MAG: sel1 repeat family protein, partial [Planctomycetaceae bacterium]|nr:sel1 repeat family protein [Planctomycetaceae bacterium]
SAAPAPVPVSVPRTTAAPKSKEKRIWIIVGISVVGFYLLMGVLGIISGIRQTANMYDEKRSVPNDPVEAAKWYRHGAERGNASAQYNLGLCYFEGKGVPKDLVEAVKWYSKAAEWGRHTDAQYRLGVCYENGQGAPKDLDKAVEWYSKAAEKGNADAQYWLGVYYTNGGGDRWKKDLDKAAEWNSKAAEQGHIAAKEAILKIQTALQQKKEEDKVMEEKRKVWKAEEERLEKNRRNLRSVYDQLVTTETVGSRGQLTTYRTYAGVSTTESVRRLLGEPDDVSMSDSGTGHSESWTYKSERGEWLRLSFETFPDGKLYLRSKSLY